MILINRILTLLIALLFDRIFRDPANKFHPVGWMGTFILKAQSLAPQERSGLQFIYGGALIISGFILFGGTAWILQKILGQLSPPISWVAGALILNFFFTVRGLKIAAVDVEQGLCNQDLNCARNSLHTHLVSRDTQSLNESQIAAATIESVAENTSDSIIAPLFFFLIGGLTGVVLYRFVNTSDSLLGYHDAKREWLGKLPARLDDLLNLIPARITAFMMILASIIKGFDQKEAIRTWLHERYNTSSPNAGHPMSATAGALNVQLEKSGHYVLGKGKTLPKVKDISRAIQLLDSTIRVMIIALVLAGIINILGIL